MPNPIIISDDEEDKDSRLTASQSRYENRSAVSVQSPNEPSRQSAFFRGGGDFQSPSSQIFSPSSRPSNFPATERQLAGAISASSKSAPSSSHVNPASSKKWPSSGRETSEQASSNSVDIIDLTGEDTHRVSQRNFHIGRMFERTERDRQPAQQQLVQLETASAISDPVARTTPQDLLRNCSSPGQTQRFHIGMNDLLQPDHASSSEAGSGPKSVQNGVNRMLELSNISPQPGRAIPWSCEEIATFAPRQPMLPSPISTISQGRDSAKRKSWHERRSQSRTSDKGQTLPAIGPIVSPKHIRAGDNASQTPETSNRPRLKINGPKRVTPQQQDPILPGHTKSPARNVRRPQTVRSYATSSHTDDLDLSGRLRTLSKEVNGTHITGSDSDDASVRMQRSIAQAAAKYNEQSQANTELQGRPSVEKGSQNLLRATEKEGTPARQPSEPALGLGSPELGEGLPPVHDMENLDLASKIPSKPQKDATDLAWQSEPRSVLRGQDPQRSSAAPQLLATELASNEDPVFDQFQQSATVQELLGPDLSTSNELEVISPDTKLLEAIFQPLLQEMRADQEYLIASFLSRARKDAAEFSGPDIDQTLPDPFAAAATSANTQSSPFDPLMRVRMESRVANARSKAPPIESQAAAFKSEARTLPKYNSIARLGSNILAQNDKDLRYLPYYSEEEEKDGDDTANHNRRKELLEGFGNRIKFLPAERKCAEQADFWREHVEYFLEDVGCTCVDVMFYLLHDEDDGWRPDCQLSLEVLSQWKERETCCDACGTKFEGDNWDRLSESLSERKPDGRTLVVAGLACLVFSKAAKFSIWHIVSTDADVQSLIYETERKWAMNYDPRGLRTQPLCMLCHVFDCPTHGAYVDDDPGSSSTDESNSNQGETDQDSGSESPDEPEPTHNVRQTVALPERPDPSGHQHRCGFFCLDPETRAVDILGLHDDGEVRGNYNKDTVKEPGDPGFADTETCSESCFWDVCKRRDCTVADAVHAEPLKRFVDWSARDVTLYKSMLPTCVQIRRGPCIMAITLSRPCSEIFGEMLLDIHVVPHAVRETEWTKVQPPLTALTYGPKDKHYWFESSQTYDHHRRQPFVPCSHSGSCHKNADCTCWTSKIACEWICGCDRACSRRFQGCRCLARGAKVCFKDSNCDCWVLNRECDPWLCGKCGVLEVLDPVNRHDDSILRGRCKNAMIQRNIPKRTLKAPSEVHGWGLFAGTDVRANEFIGEYKGEVISEEESNRRGLVYHYRGLEYLFRLNKEQEIDSSRAGNKMRFINNSERPSTINVYAQTMLCNGVQRIGLFAKRNLVAGEEMFFRYGYPESVTKHFWEKEDLEAGRRFDRDNELDNDAERIKAKGVQASVIATKEKAKKGVSKQIKKPLLKSAGKQRHAHFLDDSPGADDDPEPPISPFQQTTHSSSSRPKKRKRIPSSPVIDETTFDLPRADDNPRHEPTTSDPEDAPEAGPSSSSFGARTEIAELDSDDEEYYEEEENPSDVEGDLSASETETDNGSGEDGRRLRASRYIPPRQSTRTLQTAAARAASLQHRTRVGAMGNGKRGSTATSIGTGIEIAPSAPNIPAAANGPATVDTEATGSSTTSHPRSRRSKGKKTSGSSKDSDQYQSTARTYRGKKRGRPLGWKKGVDFK